MDNKLRARVVVIDPELSVSYPPRVTADVGVDALAHAIGSCITQDASQFDREGHPDPGYSGRDALRRMAAPRTLQ